MRCASRSPPQTPRNTARSTPRAKRCFAAACARCAPFRTDRSRGPPANSWCPHQADKNVFQRRLGRIEIGEFYAGAPEVAKETGDAGAFALGVVIVDQFATLIRQFELVGRQRGRNGVDLALQMQLQALLAELLHQAGLVLDQDDVALVDDPDAVGHLLGLADVMR